MMVQGSVSVVGGVAVGTGFAKLVYDSLEAKADFGDTTPAGLQRAKKQLADIANAAAELISFVQTNAVITSTITASGSPVPWTGTGSGTLG